MNSEGKIQNYYSKLTFYVFAIVLVVVGVSTCAKAQCRSFISHSPIVHRVQVQKVQQIAVPFALPIYPQNVGASYNPQQQSQQIQRQAAPTEKCYTLRELQQIQAFMNGFGNGPQPQRQALQAPPDPVHPAYALVNNKCSACHNNANPKAGFDATSQQSVNDNICEVLAQTVSNLMPKGAATDRGKQLTLQEKELILDLYKKQKGK